MKKAACVFIKSPEGKILLIKRSSGDYWMADKWGLPGGLADKGESAIDAALRESKEEANVHIKGLLSVFRKQHNDLDVTYFLTEEWTGIVKVSQEHTAFEWLFPEELKYYDTVPGLEELALTYASS